MVNNVVIELFKKRTSALKSISDELDEKDKRINNFQITDDPDILSNSLTSMMNYMNEVVKIDKEIGDILDNNKELFSLYKKLTDSIISENYEEATKIKKDIDGIKKT